MEKRINLSRLKETQKQYVEIYHLFREMYYFTSMNELSVRNLRIVFNLLKHVLVTSLTTGIRHSKLLLNTFYQSKAV